MELDEALQRLAIEDNRKVKVVELRYFCGFDMKETAELLNVSEATVARTGDSRAPGYDASCAPTVPPSPQPMPQFRRLEDFRNCRVVPSKSNRP